MPQANTTAHFQALNFEIEGLEVSLLLEVHTT